MNESATETDGPPRGPLIAALVVAVAAVGVILAVVATRRSPQQPVAIAAFPAPHATDPACAALLERLPPRLGDHRRAAIARPAPVGAAAWRSGDDEPVVLRCGLDRPAEFTVGSPIVAVDSVQWFEVRDSNDDGEGRNDADGSRSTWYTVDRAVYVALTLPPGSGPTPIQQLSELIGDTVAATPINPAPAGVTAPAG
ncbi:MAG TPA: DUF3515 domain-containing protein [Mycobacterium sp.]